MTAIVTGANRGIGLELVRELLARGVDVEAACRRPDEAHALRATGARVHALDVASDASAVAFARALDGRAVDLVINNAGRVGARHPHADRRRRRPRLRPVRRLPGRALCVVTRTSACASCTSA